MARTYLFCTSGMLCGSIEVLNIYEEDNLIENAAAMGKYIEEEVEEIETETSMHWRFQKYGFIGLH